MGAAFIDAGPKRAKTRWVRNRRRNSDLFERGIACRTRGYGVKLYFHEREGFWFSNARETEKIWGDQS